MTLVLDVAEAQRQPFLDFIRTLPYVTILTDEPLTEQSDWQKHTAQQFLAGYADADNVYDMSVI